MIVVARMPIIAALALTCAPPLLAQPTSELTITGTLSFIGGTSDGVILRLDGAAVRSAGTLETRSVAVTAMSKADGRFGARTPWLMDWTHLTLGRHLRIVALSTQEGVIRAAAIEDAVAGDSLLYHAAFFREKSDPVEAWLYWLAARTVAEWDLTHNGVQPIYAQGTIGDLLNSYRDPATVSAQISTYGRPGLLAGITKLHQLLVNEPRRSVIVEALPFMPKVPEKVPVGGWGFFPLRVFGVSSNGGETIIYPGHDL